MSGENDLETRADKGMRIECKAGEKYSFCTCGASGNLPFCDNTHRDVNADSGTNYKSLKVVPEKDCVIYVNSSNWKQ